MDTILVIDGIEYIVSHTTATLPNVGGQYSTTSCRVRYPAFSVTQNYIKCLIDFERNLITSTFSCMRLSN
jgi:hypothetical protein